MSRYILVDHEDFSLDAHYQAIRVELGGKLGAIASFVGLVRDRNERAGDGTEVARLVLEHYPGMTEASMEQIVIQAEERWPILASRVVHRVGALMPTDQIVMVVVASAHRDAAFAAAEFIMDYLKTQAVFWKKERSEDAEQWLAATDEDRHRADTWRQTD